MDLQGHRMLAGVAPLGQGLGTHFHNLLLTAPEGLPSHHKYTIYRCGDQKVCLGSAAQLTGR